jgi:hypothetical protein
MVPATEVVREEGVRKGEPGKTRQHGETSIDEPDYAEGLDFSGVAFHLKLEIGHWRNYQGCRATALGADRLPWK